MHVVLSITGVPIRLTDERWSHIVESHDDLADYHDEVLEAVENPHLILPGHRGTLMAVQSLARRRYLAVVYRELSSEDGFIVTAYFTDTVDRKKALWQQR